MTKRAPTVTAGYSSSMVLCRCGEVFRASGQPERVSKKFQTWHAKHAECKEKPRAGRKVFWMSFCDADRPKGQQFLGACVMEVTAAEADAALVDVLLRFPFAQPDAEWIAAATMKAHRLGCNPGGEIKTLEIPPDDEHLKFYQFGVLMDRATIDRIGAQIEAAAP